MIRFMRGNVVALSVRMVACGMVLSIGMTGSARASDAVSQVTIGERLADPMPIPQDPVPVVGLIDRLNTWGIPVDARGFFQDAVVDMGNGMSMHVGVDNFVQVVAPDGSVMFNGRVQFNLISAAAIKGVFIGLDGTGISFTVTPRQSLGSVWGFTLQTTVNGVDASPVWFDYFAVLQDPIPVPLPVPEFPKKGNRYCVCLYRLPNGTHGGAAECSIFDCDMGNPCSADIGNPPVTYGGRCRWIKVNDDGTAGFASAAFIGAAGAIGAGVLVLRRRR